MASRTDVGNMVTALYRPKPGKDDELRALIAEHLPMLRARGLATTRQALLLQAPDGTYVEIFEWLPGAEAKAHDDPEVGALWGRMALVADFPPLAELPNAQQPFPHFALVEGVTA